MSRRIVTCRGFPATAYFIFFNRTLIPLFSRCL